MLVLSLAPVHSRMGTCVGPGVSAGVGVPAFEFLGICGTAPLGEVHWKSRLFVRIGASDKLIGLLSGSRYPIIKLPPKMGSCNVPEALTRQVLRGKDAGKKTLKPRFGATWDQSVIVVGGPPVVAVGLVVAVGVIVAEAVAVVPGVLPAVAVVVTVGVMVVVGVPLAGVTVTGACSSRKTMNGLSHQCSFVSGNCDGVGFAVGDEVALPKKFKPEQDTRKKLDNSRQVDSNSHACCRRATKEKD